jgi:nucleotide-binding universal stress UspA family protein
MTTIRRILHPTDFSERSECAFRVACALARDYGAPLLVLHVCSPFVIYGSSVAVEVTPSHLDACLARLRQMETHDPRVRIEHRLVEGDAGTEILRVARENGCDLIVMGTHGRTGLGRLLMGSVAEEVVRKAPCSVLTVKTPWPAVPTEVPRDLVPTQKADALPVGCGR